MKRLIAYTTLFLSVLLLGLADAGYGETSERTLASVAQIGLADWSTFSILNIDSYTAGSGVGGGQFIQASCTPNLGTCFADSASHTFQRVYPRWDAAEWGLVGDGATTATDNSTRMGNFIAAASTAGVKTVTVSVDGPYYFATGFSIPTKMTVRCMSSRMDQIDDSSGNPTGNHKAYPYTFLIPASATITLGTSHGTSATLSGCTVENKAVFDTPNPTTLQSMYNITGNGTNAGQMGGTGVTCNGDGCKFEKGFIVGFTTGFVVNNRDTPQLNEAFIDATNCVDLEHTQFNVGYYQNFGCYSLLTQRLTNNLLALPIDAIAASPSTPANYRFHLSSPCVTGSGNCPLNGNIVWIGQPPGGAQPVGVESAAGSCTFKYIDDSNFECTNSQTTATVTTGTTVQNSERVCSVGNTTFVRKNQQVSGTGIPGGDTVVAVDQRFGCVWMAAAATASGAIANLTFTDNAYSGTDLYNLRPFASIRFGTGVILNDVHSFKINACEVYTHTTAFRITDSDGTTITGCGMHDEANLLDSSHVGLDIEGATKGVMWLGGTVDYGGNLGTAILNNQNTASSLSPNVIQTQEVGQGGIGNIILDNLGGNLVADISSGANAINGDIMVADASRSLVLDHYFGGNGVVRTQSATADAALKGCNNAPAGGSVYCNPGTSTNTLTASAVAGQANATRTSTDFVRVNVVATDGDGVMLRPAPVGRCQTLVNAAQHTMQVYGYVVTSATINGIASATGVPQAPQTTVQYCATATSALWATVVATTGSGVVCPTDQKCIWTDIQTINKNAASLPSPATGTVLQLAAADGNTSGVEIISAAANPQSSCRRADTTIASPSAVQSGDILCAAVAARPYDGSAWLTQNVGRVAAIATENFDSTHHGTDVVTSCTGPGSTGATIAAECFRVSRSGLSFTGTIPTISGTGTGGSPAIASGSTDQSGQATGQTLATQIVVTWAIAKTNAPFCLVTSPTATAFTSYASSTTALTINLAATTGAVFVYSCWQH